MVEMKHGILFCLIPFISLLHGAVSVHASEEGILQPMAGDVKNGVADSADQSKKRQVFHNLNWHSLSIRGTFSSLDVLGDEAPEEFRQYDIAANLRLPWEWSVISDWGVSTRLMASVGMLSNSKEKALAVSLIPLAVFGSRDGRFSLDMGAGGAALSEHGFGAQEFGGPFQFALTTGVSIPLYKEYSLGYRFLHYSDAGFNGSDTIGADLHMIELIYRF